MSIQIEGIQKRFGQFVALHGVDFTFQNGKLTTLLGPSGCGKTTLLRIIAGLEVADGGRVYFDGVDVTHTPTQMRGIGFVFQHYALFRHKTVADNIAFGLTLLPKKTRPTKEAITARVNELLTLVGLEDTGHKRPHELSGGQRQRIALARALATGPRYLLLDEPFGALDAKVRKQLRSWLSEIHSTLGVTSIMVTHDQEEAALVSDEVVVMGKGRIHQAGIFSQLVAHPADNFVREFLE